MGETTVSEPKSLEQEATEWDRKYFHFFLYNQDIALCGYKRKNPLGDLSADCPEEKKCPICSALLPEKIREILG